MLTHNQLLAYSRKKIRYLSKSPALRGNPQKSAEIQKTYSRSPKKPNSANRKVAKIELIYSVRVSPHKIKEQPFSVEAYIPGEGHNLKVQGAVLMRGGRVPDLPGVRYHLIRGKLSFAGLTARRTSRSLYGAKRPTISKPTKK